MVTTPYTQPSISLHKSTWKTLAVVFPFLLLFWINIAHHTMFFDEVNAWAISAASPTLAKLFYYVHFEGHPWLWYFILWFPSRLTHDPVGMKWVEAALGTAIILVIGILSPFTYKQRALILSSYFLVWEYTVMCRMYSVMLLLALIYVWRRARSLDGVVVNCALLGLMGNTDMTGVLLAGALLVEYAYSSFMATPKAARATEWRTLARRWILGLLVFVALIGLSVATLWPSKDISWQTSGHLGSQALNRHRIQHSFADMIAPPWWPISHEFPKHFWGTSVQQASWLYMLVPVVLFLYWRIFRRDRNLLLLMGCTLLFGAVFADFVYEGSVRHWGIAFISFIVGLWLQSARMLKTEQRPARWSRWSYPLFALSTISGVLALTGSWIHPFSRAREAASWVRQSAPDAVLTGMPDVSFASLGEELQRRVYFPECNCFDTFKLFSRQREDFDESNLPFAINRAMERNGHRELLFSFYRAFDEEELRRLDQSGLQIEQVASFPGADMLSESFFIYRINKR